MCSFVVKLILSQISQILPEFTHFIFITINTHLSIRIQHLPQNIQILSKSTKVPWRDLSVSHVPKSTQCRYFFHACSMWGKSASTSAGPKSSLGWWMENVDGIGPRWATIPNVKGCNVSPIVCIVIQLLFRREFTSKSVWRNPFPIHYMAIHKIIYVYYLYHLNNNK